MYLLDTNVVSMLDPRRRALASDIVDWIEHNGAGLYLSVMTITEMDAGALKLRREGKVARADQIEQLINGILSDFSDRILAMDIETARHLARLSAAAYRNPIALPDLIIAATAVRHGLTVLTRNMKDFEKLDVKALDPFSEEWRNN
jgi:predicted nucleic acid-binding protein